MKERRKKKNRKNVQDITILRMEFGMRITLKRPARRKKMGDEFTLEKSAHIDVYINTSNYRVRVSIPMHKNAIRRRDRDREGDTHTEKK